MNETTCWMCSKPFEYTGEKYQDTKCPNCGVQCSVYNPADQNNEQQINQATTEEEWLNEEEEMGELARRAKEKSPYIKLEIGESSEPLIYKSWKEITGQFGDSFRYAFEIQTEKGFIQKTFDCFQEHFAEQMDTIPFGAQVIIHRKQKLDGNGNPMENKSIYSAEEVR